jgi:hypothetical protein
MEGLVVKPAQSGERGRGRSVPDADARPAASLTPT